MTAPVRLVIFGSRTAFPTRYDIAHELLDLFHLDDGTDGRFSAESPSGLITEVISGTATGADQRGEMWAALHGIPLRRMPAAWEQHGNVAGRIRNRAMAEIATHGLGFWHSESNGTAHMAATMLALGKCVRLVEWRRP